MASRLRIGDRMFSGEDALLLLQQYGLLQQLGQQVLVDEVLKNWEQSEAGQAAWTPAAEEQALQQIQQQLRSQQLNPMAMQQAGLAGEEAQAQLNAQRQQAMLRQVKLDKFKQDRWGNQVETYFLQRKARLDRVIYSLLRLKDAAIAQELYFRLQAGEATFTELATRYSQGPESNTGGLIGPADVGSCHPQIGQVLRVSQPGQLWPPSRIEEWWVIVRMEKFLPAQLDEGMQRRMLDELFSTWIQEQSRQIGLVDVEIPT